MEKSIDSKNAQPQESGVSTPEKEGARDYGAQKLSVAGLDALCASSANSSTANDKQNKLLPEITFTDSGNTDRQHQDIARSLSKVASDTIRLNYTGLIDTFIPLRSSSIINGFKAGQSPSAEGSLWTGGGKAVEDRVVAQLAAALLLDEKTAESEKEKKLADTANGLRSTVADIAGLAATYASSQAVKLGLNLIFSEPHLKLGASIAAGLIAGGVTNNAVRDDDLLGHRGFLRNTATAGLLSASTFAYRAWETPGLASTFAKNASIGFGFGAGYQASKIAAGEREDGKDYSDWKQWAADMGRAGAISGLTAINVPFMTLPLNLLGRSKLLSAPIASATSELNFGAGGLPTRLLLGHIAESLGNKADAKIYSELYKKARQALDSESPENKELFRNNALDIFLSQFNETKKN